MTAIITEHVPDPIARILNTVNGIQTSEPWFDVSCDDCGWQSKATTDGEQAEKWRHIHDGNWPDARRGCPL